VIRKHPLPADIRRRIASLGDVLADCPGVVFAYLFGGAAEDRLGLLSDVDVAVYLDGSCDAVEARLEAIRRVTAHLGTDEVDLVVLNTAPTALLGRILLQRKVLCDREPFRRHRFESLALRQFFDFRIYERRLLERRAGRG
jgi:hypothetical protein